MTTDTHPRTLDAFGRRLRMTDELYALLGRQMALAVKNAGGDLAKRDLFAIQVIIATELTLGGIIEEVA